MQQGYSSRQSTARTAPTYIILTATDDGRAAANDGRAARKHGRAIIIVTVMVAARKHSGARHDRGARDDRGARIVARAAR